jgi:hypothetical protein
MQHNAFYPHDDRYEWTDIQLSSGRGEDDISGICQCVEELQEEGTVKVQSRGPYTQKRPHDEECLLSTLGT